MQIESVCEDGTVIFPDGSSVLGDIILHCTEYVAYSLEPEVSLHEVSY